MPSVLLLYFVLKNGSISLLNNLCNKMAIGPEHNFSCKYKSTALVGPDNHIIQDRRVHYLGYRNNRRTHKRKELQIWLCAMMTRLFFVKAPPKVAFTNEALD